MPRRRIIKKEEKELLNVDKIFITHYSKLTERKKNLSEALNKYLKNEVEWCQDFDRETISKEDLKKYVSDPKLHHERKPKELYNSDPPSFRDLTMAEICNAINHFDIYRKIVENNIERAIILEDDVVLDKNILKFNEMLEKTPDDFDMIYFGQNFEWEVFKKLVYRNTEQPSGYSVVKADPPNSRTADAYVITNKAAKKYVENVKEFVLGIDFEMNYWNWKFNFNVYHWWPGICYQGSMFNNYNSSVKGRTY